MAFGVYIHFPYCLSKCPYCDFASQATRAIPHRRFSEALALELAIRRPATEGRVASTLYFGGGTPSLWDPRWLGATTAKLREEVRFDPGGEWTLEANPGAADASRFAAFRAAGLDRISIGIQSFAPEVLALLGRRHTGAEACLAVKEARAAGFDRIAVDLIYGAPGQTLEGARADAEQAAALGPEHVSVYALTLDVLAVPVPMARWVEQGRLQVPDEETVVAMGAAVREVLDAAGLTRYEISNHARAGRASRHNTLYWTGGEYLGLGPGASGFAFHHPEEPWRGGRRWSNHRSIRRWFEAVESGMAPEESSELLTANDLLRERMVMGLRLLEGVDIGGACRELHQDPTPLMAEARRLQARGLAVIEGERLRLSPRGLDFHSDAVLGFV